MNAHVHLLEAFTALYQIRPAALLVDRLSELIRLVRDRMVVSPPGAMHQLFFPDWTTVPGVCSFGHEIETAYLLLDASRALQPEPEPRTVQVARALADHCLQWGWDAAHGGLWDSGGAFGPLYVRRKVWWVQAETLNTLALMARNFPDEPLFRARLLEQWAYIRRFMVDHLFGGWTDSGRDTPRWLEAKSSE